MTSNPWFVNFKKRPLKKFHLFCFHHSGGGASMFHPWVEHLSPSIELIAIQLPGRETRFTEKLTNSLPEILDNLTEGFNSLKETPFIVFGHSLGGLLAYEFAKEVYEKFALLPTHLIISAMKAPHMPRKRDLHTLNDRELAEKLKLFDGIDDKILQNEELLELFLPIIRSDFSISETYHSPTVKQIPCNITHLSGREDKTLSEQDIMEWKKYTNLDFKSLSFVGGHFFIKNNQNTIIKYINDKAESHT